MTIKHIHSTALLCLIWVLFSCTPQSSTENFADDLEFAIHEVEYNYAGFPLLTEEELAEYEVMKAALRDSVDAGVYLDYEAVGHYLAWFQNPHLRTSYRICVQVTLSKRISGNTMSIIPPCFPMLPEKCLAKSTMRPI